MVGDLAVEVPVDATVALGAVEVPPVLADAAVVRRSWEGEETPRMPCTLSRCLTSRIFVVLAGAVVVAGDKDDARVAGDKVVDTGTGRGCGETGCAEMVMACDDPWFCSLMRRSHTWFDVAGARFSLPLSSAVVLVDTAVEVTSDAIVVVSVVVDAHSRMRSNCSRDRESTPGLMRSFCSSSRSSLPLSSSVVDEAIAATAVAGGEAVVLVEIADVALDDGENEENVREGFRSGFKAE